MSAAAIAWITGYDTGVSSKAIWAHMMGGVPDRGWRRRDHPYDPDDFGRCYRLLCIVPEWRPRIGEMAQYGPEWAALAGAWEELSGLYETEVGAGKDAAHRFFGKIAPMLYARMRALIMEQP